MKSLILVVLPVLLAATAEAQVLKIATIAPENSSWVKGMREGIDEIKMRTDGRVVIKLYSGGIQGSDEAVLKKIRIKQLQGAAFTPFLLRKSYKDIILYNLPMVFNDEAEVAYVREKLDQTLMRGLEEAGFVSFGFTATGFSVILSDDPVRGVEDLRGKKIWTPESDTISIAALKALGLNPVTLPLADVYTGLQTKLIEIMPGSATGAILMQWYTSVNYFTDLPLVYTVGLLAFDKSAFDKLRPGDQAIVREVMTEFTVALDKKSPDEEAGAKKALENKGVQRITPDPAKVAEIRAIVQESNRNMVEQGELSLELYDQLMGYLAEYRQAAAEGGSGRKKGSDTAPTVAAGQK